MTEAVARRDKATRMNKTEAQYAEVLEIRLRAGEIYSWRYEPITLRLADDTRYTPDFMVIGALGQIAFHEVKGFWRDDALVKIKVAAELFPEFKFFALRLEKGQWVSREF